MSNAPNLRKPNKYNNHDGEFDLIRRFQQIAPEMGSSLIGIGDDTAVLPFNQVYSQLYAADMIVEGVHFTSKDPLEHVGYKALACNMSDIAAMGGRPTYAVVSLGLRKSLKTADKLKIFKGISSLAKKHNVKIVGGDTVSSDKIIVSIALLGLVKKDQLVLRSGAKVNDRIYVTGSLGGSFKSKRHLTFRPRLNEAQYLCRYYRPSSMIDISDGLSGDLNHLLQYNKLSADLYSDDIPRHKDATLEQCLHEGEDFELLFTLSKKQSDLFNNRKSSTFQCYEIGVIKKGPQAIYLIDKDLRKIKIKPRAYTHF